MSVLTSVPTTRLPELKVTQTYNNGNLKISIAQLQDTMRLPVYRLPMEVEVWENGFKTRYHIVMNKYKQEFTMEVYDENFIDQSCY